MYVAIITSCSKHCKAYVSTSWQYNRGILLQGTLPNWIMEMGRH